MASNKNKLKTSSSYDSKFIVRYGNYYVRDLQELTKHIEIFMEKFNICFYISLRVERIGI